MLTCDILLCCFCKNRADFDYEIVFGFVSLSYADFIRSIFCKEYRISYFDIHRASLTVFKQSSWTNSDNNTLSWFFFCSAIRKDNS